MLNAFFGSRLRGAGLVAGSLLSLPCAGMLQASASAPADAVVFVRTFGDVTIDVTSDWEGPAVLEDRELATGTAFAIAPSGLLVTNHHVVTGGSVVRAIKGSSMR